MDEGECTPSRSVPSTEGAAIRAVAQPGQNTREYKAAQQSAASQEEEEDVRINCI